MRLVQYWAWETTATLHLLGGTRGAGVPTGGEGRGHIVAKEDMYFPTFVCVCLSVY